MLTDAQVRKIKPLEKKTKYSDEKGMYLEVTPSGGMHWRMKFRFNGKENIFSIGTYPETTLAQARRARDEARLGLKDGINPNEAKKQKKIQVNENTLLKRLLWNGWKTVKLSLKTRLIYGTYLFLRKIFFLLWVIFQLTKLKGKMFLPVQKN
jgi:hypothetical protein